MTGRGNHERPTVTTALSIYQTLRVEQMNRTLNGSPTYAECLGEFPLAGEAIARQDQLEHDRPTKLLCNVLVRPMMTSTLKR
jgi:hypothetical protein